MLPEATHTSVLSPYKASSRTSPPVSNSTETQPILRPRISSIWQPVGLQSSFNIHDFSHVEDGLFQPRVSTGSFGDS